MSTKVRKYIKIFAILISIPILALISLLVYSTITDYSPPEQIQVNIKGTNSDEIPPSDTLSLVTWNIGYAGLGAGMDFFYDGGKQVRPSKDIFDTYLEGVGKTVSDFSTADFVLIQEADLDSKRSYETDEITYLAEKLPGQYYGYGINYLVDFVPQPFTDPLGKVNAGLLTFSKRAPISATRHSFPGNYAWPTRVFMLDRCFMVFRYQWKNDKELLVINTHNSAYDDGTLKQQQMDYLKEFLLGEYEKGNYVIVGGDWNQCPPNFRPESFAPAGEGNSPPGNISMDYLPSEWTWIYDPTIPTNRSLLTPFDNNHSFRTLIDFFLLSPNMRAISVEGIDLGFAHSDHQPVKIQVIIQ